MKFLSGFGYKKIICFSVVLFISITSLFLIISSNSDKTDTFFIPFKAESSTYLRSSDYFSWDNSTIYFLLTDRFKNADTDNDHSYNRCLDENGAVLTSIDESATFHGGDFKGVTEKINDNYFNDLGVNVLWISAPYEQIHGYVIGGADSGFAHYAYHGYYALDYTSTDANFGTPEEFEELVDTAHSHGLRIMLDISLNHAGYNSMYDMNEYNFGTLKDGWDDYYYGFQNVTETRYNSYIDFNSSSDDWSRWWGNNWIRSNVVGYEKGNTELTQCLFGLPDFKTESPVVVNSLPPILTTKWTKEGRYDEEVASLDEYFSKTGKSKTVSNYLVYWLSEWVRDYGIDGFRCDGAKNVDLNTWSSLKSECTDALREWKSANTDKALDSLDFYMLGECWDHGLGKDSYYTEGNFDSLLNFSTENGQLLSPNEISSTYSSYAKAVNNDPTFNVVSFISSHDTTIADGDSISLGSSLLLLPGGVQIYYGDESNRGINSAAAATGNHNLRSDMNWNTLNLATTEHWQKVGTFRSSHISIGAGSNNNVNSTSGYAFTRHYENDGIIDSVAACINAEPYTNVEIEVSNIWSNKTKLINYYDGSKSTVDNGKVIFNSGKNGTILIQEDDSTPLVSISGKSGFNNKQDIKVSLVNADYASYSIDGSDKHVIYDGDTITIGDTAYPGDTIAIEFEAFSDQLYTRSMHTFYKAYDGEIINNSTSDDITTSSYDSSISVKTPNDFAPYIYAYNNLGPLLGDWPGTQATNIINGYYVIMCPTDDVYNLVIHDGNYNQTPDILKIKGDSIIDISSDDYKTFSSDYDSTFTTNYTRSVTLHIKPYVNGSIPYLYTWNDNEEKFTGGFPGISLSSPDSDGWFSKTIYGTNSLNAIISSGDSSDQTNNLLDLSGEVWLTITSADSKNYTIRQEKSRTTLIDELKTEAKSIKVLTSTDYINSGWNELIKLVDTADSIILDYSDNISSTKITRLYNKIKKLKSNLELTKPIITSAKVNSTSIKGIAPCGSHIELVYDDTIYKLNANEYTGEWSLDVPTLKKHSSFTVVAIKGGVSSDKLTYNVK